MSQNRSWVEAEPFKLWLAQLASV